MKRRKKAIHMLPEDDSALKKLYLSRRIPVDQYEQRPDQLMELAKEWNLITGRFEEASDLLHYMRTERKNGNWVRLDGAHIPKPRVTQSLTADDTDVLVAIYSEHVVGVEGVGSDVLGHDPQVAAFIAREFFQRTRKRIPEYVLITKLTELRKRGLLPKVGPRREPGIRFGDIDKATGL